MGQPDLFNRTVDRLLVFFSSRPSEVGLGTRASNFFVQHGYQYVGEVAHLTFAELLKHRNIGLNTAAEIQALFKAAGAQLGLPPTGWQKEFAKQIRLDCGLDAAPSPKKEYDLSAISAQAAIFLASRVEEIDFSVRLQKGLTAAGIEYMGDLGNLRAASLTKLENFGWRSLEELRKAFRANGLELDMPVRGWGPELANEVRAKFSTLKSTSSEALGSEVNATVELEVIQTIGQLVNERGLRIVVALWGLDGENARTLESVGIEFGITRERVRQISAKLRRKIQIRMKSLSPLSMPYLGKAISTMNQLAPLNEMDMKRALEPYTCLKPSSLLVLAEVFHKPCNLRVIKLDDGARLVAASDFRDLIDSAFYTAKRLTSRNGILNVAALTQSLKGKTARSVVGILEDSGSIAFLDAEKEWLWVAQTSRNRLSNLIKKVASVCTELTPIELKHAVSKSRRLDYTGPSTAIAAFCQAAGLGKIMGHKIHLFPPGPIELGENEAVIRSAFDRSQPVLTRSELEDYCIEEHGLNPISFSIILGSTPLISRLAPGLFSLVGAQVSPPELEAALERVRHVRRGATYGWTSEGMFYYGFTIARSLLYYGSHPAPSFVVGIANGTWSATTSSDFALDPIECDGGFIKGLKHSLRILGAEAGDMAVLIFDVVKRKVIVAVSNEELLDRLEQGEALLPEHSIDEGEDDTSIEGEVETH